jgi:hypothetical protein
MSSASRGILSRTVIRIWSHRCSQRSLTMLLVVGLRSRKAAVSSLRRLARATKALAKSGSAERFAVPWASRLTTCLAFGVARPETTALAARSLRRLRLRTLTDSMRSHAQCTSTTPAATQLLRLPSPVCCCVFHEFASDGLCVCRLVDEQAHAWRHPHAPCRSPRTLLSTLSWWPRQSSCTRRQSRQRCLCAPRPDVSVGST